MVLIQFFIFSSLSYPKLFFLISLRRNSVQDEKDKKNEKDENDEKDEYRIWEGKKRYV